MVGHGTNMVHRGEEKEDGGKHGYHFCGCYGLHIPGACQPSEQLRIGPDKVIPGVSWGASAALTVVRWETRCTDRLAQPLSP